MLHRLKLTSLKKHSGGATDPFNYLTGEKIFVTAPLIWQDNFEERLKFFSQRKLIWNYWVQLIRRDFIIENSIKAVGVVPNVIYHYRQRKDSLVHKNYDVAKFLTSRATMLAESVRHLDDFLSGREFFSRRPDLKYLLFDTSTQRRIAELEAALKARK
ncbi:MAG: hypothetical protein SR1Q7_01840 [Quinella sp. 1Q7]|nr:hypothetical protein [Quinella sp. 1Q7]